MRRLLILATMLGLLAFPATASAAPSPTSTIAVSSAHYVARGVVEIDVSYSCVAPPRGWAWEPSLYVELSQGRNRTWRAGYAGIDLTRALCDGAIHVAVVRVAAEEGAPLKGGRVSVYALVDATWWNADDDWIEQYASFEGVLRVHRR